MIMIYFPISRINKENKNLFYSLNYYILIKGE